jgi:quinolinate synthase
VSLLLNHSDNASQFIMPFKKVMNPDMEAACSLNQLVINLKFGIVQPTPTPAMSWL